MPIVTVDVSKLLEVPPLTLPNPRLRCEWKRLQNRADEAFQMPLRLLLHPKPPRPLSRLGIASQAKVFRKGAVLLPWGRRPLKSASVVKPKKRQGPWRLKLRKKGWLETSAWLREIPRTL